jgi:hypothetical protein
MIKEQVGKSAGRQGGGAVGRQMDRGWKVR